jgi:type I restriction-modification system DNA methylase subunit/predicted type IV restriction endonuclease
MTTNTKILGLVERFEGNLEAYKQGNYNETQLRREFIDPFFEELGWDVANKKGYAEAYKEVVHEDAIKVGRATKAPDYSFRIGGVRKFFLEAKKPSVNIKDDLHPAYQLRRYAWSAKLPLSILTDFEEFAVYDCRIKPVKTDQASHSRILYMTYTEYPERWEEIANIFSREAILKGSFDKYVESKKGKRGTAEVDAAFLQEIERWRDILAKNIALRNPRLTQRELNFAIQQTIDRIIFLRICEDRGIEFYGRLMALQNGHHIYRRLLELFYQADDRYNSGLFHFKMEKNRFDIPDALTPKLKIDDKVLKDILENLYYPDSPYEFSVLPADILGQVYEQFLGKVIRLTQSHRAVVEDKPEVRKAGGVYYTPTYIVDYIVKQTVGKLVEGKKPGPRGGVSSIKILDPACGSGSFLLGAYQYLLDWHRDEYMKDGPEKWARGSTPRLYQTSGGGWKLTIEERQRILLNNIYGVDIDPQAVEVTKLSLLLKVLEGEDEQTIGRQLSLFHKRVLPDLVNNIKCGNSLIGPDFYQGKQLARVLPGMSFPDDEEMHRINAFDWDKEFPEIMNPPNPPLEKGGKGGFDVVIGNPPYIRIQAMKEWAPQEVEFYKGHYVSASKGNYDIYVVFVEKGLSILKRNGLFGFILPNKFFNAQYGMPLRQLISQGKYLSHIVHFGFQQVFYGATNYTCLLFLDKSSVKQFYFTKVDSLDDWRIRGSCIESAISSKHINADEWNFKIGKGAELFERLKAIPLKLGDISDIFVGLQTSADDVFIMDLIKETPHVLHLYSKSLNTDWIFEKGLLHPLASGTDVKRYQPLPNRQYILFPYSVRNEIAELIDFDTISNNYKRAAEYLLKNQKRLEEREHGKFKDYEWYRFGRSQNIGIQNRTKICIPRLVERLRAAMDENGGHFLDNVDVGGITLKQEYNQHDLRYLLGLLNSKLLRWYFPSVSAPFRGGWLSANRQFLSQLPIRITNFTNQKEKSRHDQIVRLVNLMLDLNKQLTKTKTPQSRTIIQRQIETIDRQIDELVYELYDLTKEEIEIVESSI